MENHLEGAPVVKENTTSKRIVFFFDRAQDSSGKNDHFAQLFHNNTEFDIYFL